MAHDRDVAGMRCSEVLEHLSGYLDGELDEAVVVQLEAHLRGCSWCERFGGDFSAAVADLRRLLGERATGETKAGATTNDVDPEQARRLAALQQRLNDEG